MKHLITRSIQILALLVALAVPAFSEESNRGLYEGDLAGGGKAVFFVQGNHAISAYLFDVAGQQASYGGGAIKHGGAFSLKLQPDGTVTGTLGTDSITGSFGGQNFTAPRVSPFEHSGVTGRFSGAATGANGSVLQLKVVLDADGNMFLIARDGKDVLGGFGTLTVQPVTGDSETTDGGDDEDQDGNKDPNSTKYAGTFTVTLMDGTTITGTVGANHGTFWATFTFNGVEYKFHGLHESSANHLANISTRGFVNTGQGQLIGGFIITGGPKMVLVRASGPSLAASGVSPVLADPKLQLLQGQTVLKENDDWQTNANASDIIATTLAPTDSKESALLLRLEPGAYTAVVTGADGGTGIALIEVYEIDRD